MLLEKPETLSLQALRQVGRKRQLHLKICGSCGDLERVANALVDRGAQVSLVRAGPLLPGCPTTIWRLVGLKVANSEHMVGGMKEAVIALQVVNHCELSRPDLGKEILSKGNFYERRWTGP